MRRIGIVMALQLSLLVLSGVSALAAQQRLEPIKFKDALGTELTMPRGDGTVWTVVFTSEKTGDAARVVFRDLDEKFMNDPDLETVAVADTRSYNNLFAKGIAKGKLKDRAFEALDKRRERRAERGLDTSDEWLRRWHIVGDFNGKILKAFGVSKETPLPSAVVVDRCGTPSALVTGEGIVAKTIAAIEDAKERSLSDCSG